MGVQIDAQMIYDWIDEWTNRCSNWCTIYMIQIDEQT